MCGTVVSAARDGWPAYPLSSPLFYFLRVRGRSDRLAAAGLVFGSDVELLVPDSAQACKSAII
jgi:hypothetical protein